MCKPLFTAAHNLQRAKGQAATEIHMESGNHLPNFHFGGSMSVFVGGGQSMCSAFCASSGMTDRCVLILILSGSDAKGKTLSPAMAWSTLYVTHALLRTKKLRMKLMLETSRNYINKYNDPKKSSHFSDGSFWFNSQGFVLKDKPLTVVSQFKWSSNPLFECKATLVKPITSCMEPSASDLALV